MMRNFRLRWLGWVMGVALVGVVAVPGAASGSAGARPAAGTATATPIDPDTFQCSDPGFVGFENLADATALTTGSISGLRFSTPGGDTWRVGDFGAGDGAKFPAGPYTSEETHWATVADGTATAQIAFPGGAASDVIVLVSDYSPITLQAFAKNGSPLNITPPAHVPDGRHMIQMEITEPSKNIDHVVLDGGGSQFQIDSICTDAGSVPQPQLFLTVAAGAPKSTTTVNGTGFGPNETVDISINNCFSGSAQTGASGAFVRSIPICSTAPPGPATINATGRVSGRSGTANFVVRTDWIQNGFDPGRSAYNPFENQISPANAHGLHLAWSLLTGGRPTEAVVAKGVVYAGSADGAVYAVNDATGAVLWSCVPGTQPCTSGGPGRAKPGKFIALRGAPVIDGNRLLVAGADGNLYALDPGTGNPLWHFTIGTALNRAPLVKNGIVYIGADDHKVYAVHEATGTAAWPAPVDMGSAVHSTLAADNSHVYVGTDSGNLYALDLLTGAQAWVGHTNLQIRSSPAVANGVVFVGSADGSVYAWNATNGQQLWAHPTGAPVGAAIAVAKGLVYVGTELGDLDELSVSTGAVVHSFDTKGSITSRAAEANGVVYVGSGSKKVFVLSQATLTKLFSAPLDTNVTEIAIANGAMYVGSDNHELEKFVP